MSVNKSNLGIKSGVTYSEDEDEVVVVGTLSPDKSGKKTNINNKSSDNPHKKADNDFDVGSAVEALSDEELFKQLVDFGEEIGPVVDSTRKLYRRRLTTLLLNGSGPVNEGEREGKKKLNDENGSDKPTKRNGVNNDSYSADEEEAKSKEVAQEKGVSSRISERKSTPSRRVSNRSSNIKQAAEEIRASEARFVPTARAPIHSYTVKERSTWEVLEDDKGVITTNSSFVRERTESSNNKEQADSNWRLKLSVVLNVLMVVLVIALSGYGYWSMGRGVLPQLDRVIDYVATTSYRAISSQQSVDDDDEQPSIANV